MLCKKKLTFIKIYGIKKAKQIPETLQDFITQQKALSKLLLDSAVFEMFKTIYRHTESLQPQNMQLKPIYQNQNT